MQPDHYATAGGTPVQYVCTYAQYKNVHVCTYVYVCMYMCMCFCRYRLMLRLQYVIDLHSVETQDCGIGFCLFVLHVANIRDRGSDLYVGIDMVKNYCLYKRYGRCLAKKGKKLSKITPN